MHGPYTDMDGPYRYLKTLVAKPRLNWGVVTWGSLTFLLLLSAHLPSAHHIYACKSCLEPDTWPQSYSCLQIVNGPGL